MSSTARKPTEFETRVYEAVSQVPRGKVTTYGLLAGHIGCGSPRAVGQALSRNPYAPRVPCHRVIASDLGIGGFSGRREGAAIRKKKRLLSDEGVRFENNQLVDAKSKLYTFGKRKRPHS